MWLFCQSKNHKSMQWLFVCVRARNKYLWAHYMGKNISHPYQNRIHSAVHAYVHIFPLKHIRIRPIYCIHLEILWILIRVITQNLLLSTFCAPPACAGTGTAALAVWVCRGSLLIFLFSWCSILFFPFVSLNSLSNNRWLLVGFAYWYSHNIFYCYIWRVYVMHNMNDKLVSNSHDQCPAQKFFRSRNKNPNECVEKAKKKTCSKTK